MSLLVTGSIGIDLPTLPRARRQAAAAMVDAILPPPFERSAVNGFGFLQIVRRRIRPSIPEILRADPAAAAARALLRRAGRLQGRVALHAAPRVNGHTPALSVVGESRAAASSTPEALPGYEKMTIAQLRGKLRTLTVDEVTELLEWETAHGNRPPFVTMLSNLITTVTEG